MKAIKPPYRRVLSFGSSDTVPSSDSGLFVAGDSETVVEFVVEFAVAPVVEFAVAPVVEFVVAPVVVDVVGESVPVVDNSVVVEPSAAEVRTVKVSEFDINNHFIKYC